MKRTSTITIALSLGLMLAGFGRLTGTGTRVCPHGRGFAGMSNSNPNQNCAGACHGGGSVIVTGPTSPFDTTGGTGAVDTTTTHQGSGTTTGLADIAFRAGISVYPTVTTGAFSIATSERSQDMMVYGVYTLDGRMVGAGMLPDYAAVSQLDIRALPAAQYIIRIAAGDLSASYHLIKQ